MNLSYVKINPAENMTIFVLDKVNRQLHKSVANRLMDYNSLHGEQVGFIEEPESLQGKSLKTKRLQMMGGEFCGNATRSLAAYLVFKDDLIVKKIEDKFYVILEVSGLNHLISCEVRITEKDNLFYSKIDMPHPTDIRGFTVEVDGKRVSGKRVDFLGITHFIVDIKEVEDREKLFSTIKSQMDQEDYDAFGIMYYDYREEFLIPLVYVKNTDTMYWERSCASGTTALVISLAQEDKNSIIKKIKQPGGELVVEIECKGENITKVRIDGLVEIVGEGTVFIK